MRDVLSDGIRRVGGGERESTSLRLCAAGGHPEVTSRWTTSAPVSNEMHTDAGKRGALGAGGMPGFSGGHSPIMSFATLIFISSARKRDSVQIHKRQSCF